MHIAVTGATGFIGRYLVQHLLDEGDTCRCWLRDASRREGMPEAIDWIPGRLNDQAAADALVDQCDVVIHSALDRPGTGFRGAEGNVPDFAERNIVGTLRLIEAARQAGVRRFVLISTCAVHERIRDDRPLDENHACTPLTHYGAHKAALEMFVHSYGWGEGFSICALRPTGVYGVANPKSASKWFELVQRVASGDTIECRRGGKEVHARDVARAARLLATTEQDPSGECFNCYDRYISEFEVASLAKAISGSDAVVTGEPKQPKHQIETQKLRSIGMTFGGEALLRETVSDLVSSER